MTPEEQVANSIARGDPNNPVAGDCYDHELGYYLGAMTDEDDNLLTRPPLQIEIFVNGKWYRYSIVDINNHEPEVKDG